MDFSYFAYFLILGVGFCVFVYILAWMIRPSNPYKDKSAIYECGEETVGPTWIQFNFRYYTFALIFVVFDIETIFLYPWALVYRKLGLFAGIEMLIFIGILVIGFIYAWKKGALEWL